MESNREALFLIKELEPMYESTDKDSKFAIYSFPTEDNKPILVQSAAFSELSDDDKVDLYYVKDAISKISADDIANIFKDRKEGVAYIRNKDIPLIDLHVKLNGHEEAKYYNMTANNVIEAFYKDSLKEPVYVTTIVGIVDLPDGSQSLINYYFEQGKGVSYIFGLDKIGDTCLAKPISAEVLTPTKMARLIVDDIMLRIKTCELYEDHMEESYEDFLLPIDATAELILNN